MAFLKPAFAPRLYQETILATAAEKNTLVVLPTGMGKTAIAALLAAQRLEHHPAGKILFLAPTKPLAQQHLGTFKDLYELPEEKFVLFTGHVAPEKRVALWQEATFIFSTPQGMENDLISRRLSLEDVSLVVFDEAHRAVGNYAYNYICKHYCECAKHERILALTASPGSNEQTIRDVCANLSIEAIEVRSADDPDVAPYTQELDITFVKVALDQDTLKVREQLKRCNDRKLAEAATLGEVQGDILSMNKTTLLQLQGALHARMAHGEKHYELLKTISLMAEALKVQHALELCESQSVKALTLYLESLQQQSLTTKTKAVQNLVKDTDFKSALAIAQRMNAEGKEHPKMDALRNLVQQEIISDSAKKLIIFTQFRDTAVVIKERLSDITSAQIFVGQAKKGETGLSQKQQKAMIEEFKTGGFTTLIATSVAEEGLDIPAVDAVIFYEPIPSAIRTVQRRGRTGRHAAGKVYLLIAQGTRDEAYRWSAHHKEKRMHRTLAQLKKTFTPQPVQKEQSTLQDYDEGVQTVITVDYREKGSAVMKALLSSGAKLDLAQLAVGDYRIGEDVVVEYKTVKDFVDSIIDGRLLSQLRELRSAYKPLIIIEGQDDLYAQRRVSAASIRGMLAAIILSYHIPVLRTVSAADTAGVLLAMARREASRDERAYTAHAGKPWSLREQQEYVVASLPGIGAKLAKPLLEKFGTVAAVFGASVEELQEIDLIGEKKAKKIREVLDAAYHS